jgi:hypothetical protein
MLDCAYLLGGCRGSIRLGFLSCTNLLCIAHNKCTRHTILFFYFGSGGFRDCTYFKAVGWKQDYGMAEYSEQVAAKLDT